MFADFTHLPNEYYTYRTWKELDGYLYVGHFATYGGGGYVAELGKIRQLCDIEDNWGFKCYITKWAPTVIFSEVGKPQEKILIFGDHEVKYIAKFKWSQQFLILFYVQIWIFNKTAWNIKKTVVCSVTLMMRQIDSKHRQYSLSLSCLGCSRLWIYQDVLQSIVQ